MSPSLGPICWRENADPHKSSSDLYLYAMTGIYTHVHSKNIPTHAQNKCSKKANNNLAKRVRQSTGSGSNPSNWLQYKVLVHRATLRVHTPSGVLMCHNGKTMQPKWSTKPERFIWLFTEKVNQHIVTDPLVESVCAQVFECEFRHHARELTEETQLC